MVSAILFPFRILVGIIVAAISAIVMIGVTLGLLAVALFFSAVAFPFIAVLIPWRKLVTDLDSPAAWEQLVEIWALCLRGFLAVGNFLLSINKPFFKRIDEEE